MLLMMLGPRNVDLYCSEVSRFCVIRFILFILNIFLFVLSGTATCGVLEGSFK